MSAQHTPGPWAVGETYNDEWDLPETMIRGEGTNIAVALDIDINRPGVREANAALIAAAPDLLAALELVLTFMHPDHPAGQQARAAIAKTRLAAPESAVSEPEDPEDLQDEVRKAVKIIAGNARVSFRAEVESVQFKGASDIKAVLKLIGGPEAHSLADAAGGFVTVLIENIDELLAVPQEALQGEPENKSLFDASTEGTALDTEREGELAEA